MQDCQEGIAYFIFSNAFYAEKALKTRSILIDSARIIKKIAEISKKDLTNETGGCILAPSNGKGVVSGEGS